MACKYLRREPSCQKEELLQKLWVLQEEQESKMAGVAGAREMVVGDKVSKVVVDGLAKRSARRLLP